LKIDYSLPRELSAAEETFVKSALERSLNVVAIEVTASRLSVELSGEISEDRFNEVMQNLLYVSRSISRKTLYENSEKHLYCDNPMQALLDSGDVVRVAEGMFSFQGSFLKLLKACQGYALGIAEKYNAIEQDHPVLWPIDLYKKINYFSEFPQQVIMGVAVENSFEARDDFANNYEKEQSYENVSTKEHFSHATYGLQCAVCDICYYNMRGGRDHQNTVYTTCNKVFRNESSATGSLDRLTTFTVRDVMFVGDRDFVLLYRQKMLDEAEVLLRKLDLECKIETADDPFFTNDSVVKNLFQSASELKHELLVKLNHSDSFMAVGSVNLHLDFFGQAFDIQAPDSTPVYSGCFGIGFERLAYALCCQYGIDIQKWPTKVKETLKLK
jgi:seryl-tRNA synthetase